MRTIYRWYVRQCTQTNCSPALAGLGILLVIAAVIYVYREVILTTLITAVCAAVAVAVFTGAIAVTISTLRWYRRTQRTIPIPVESDTWTKVDAELDGLRTTLADEEAITAEADDLARAGTELIFDKDGNLHAKRS